MLVSAPCQRHGMKPYSGRARGAQARPTEYSSGTKPASQRVWTSDMGLDLTPITVTPITTLPAGYADRHECLRKG